jgi:hypothetical protein
VRAAAGFVRDHAPTTACGPNGEIHRLVSRVLRYPVRHLSRIRRSHDVYATSRRLGDKDLLEATNRKKQNPQPCHRRTSCSTPGADTPSTLPYIGATAAVCTVTGHTLQLAQATDVVADVVAHARARA